MTEITPAEASAAHPKCGTCAHLVVSYKAPAHEWTVLNYRCKHLSGDSKSGKFVLDFSSHYCPNHSELTKENNNE